MRPEWRKRKITRVMSTTDWKVICEKCKNLGFNHEIYEKTYYWGKLTFDLARLENLKAQGFEVSPPNPKLYLKE